MLEVPWGTRSDDRLDIREARRILDEDHTGLADVKDRIVEYLAVRKLRAEREPAASEVADDAERDRPTRGAGAIVALVGPPGVGKTSLGESVARALGRKFVRIALGGVRDEAEIRGHRRTYVGARPGRLVRAISEAGTMNPVVLLDEVDKLGADWRGDPSSALLEVLDPAQNHTFRDHYLEVDLDLSDVLFLATANVAETIPGPLLDRMELVRLDGYTEDEKVGIGRDHLWSRQRTNHALTEDEVSITDDALRLVVTDYTREAGVRNLERELGKVLRKVAAKVASGDTETPVVVDTDDVRPLLGRAKFFAEAAERTAAPGVATGLAVTGTGGDVLFIEATVMDGEPGLTLTGQLGDVMQESVRIALSYVEAHREELGDRPGTTAAAVPRARARGRGAEGRSVGRHHDDHRARQPAVGPGRAGRRRDDGRGHPPGQGAADRRRQAEGARGATGRDHHRDPAAAQRARPGGRARGRARAAHLPPRRRRAGGARARARAGCRGGGSRLGRRGRRLGHRRRASVEVEQFARLEREVARGEAPGGELSHLGLLVGAALLRLRAAGPEPAAARRRHRRRDLALERLAVLGSDRRIGHGDRGRAAPTCTGGAARRTSRRAARTRTASRGRAPRPCRSRSSRPRGRGR